MASDARRSSWPPSPSAWASTRRTSATSTTTTCPRAWRTTRRRSAGPAATGSRRPARCSSAPTTSTCWRTSSTATRRPRGRARPGRATLFAQGDEFDVSLYELSSEHDIRPLVVSTLLTYLELDGYLEGGTPFYADYQFQPLAPSAEILATSRASGGDSWRRSSGRRRRRRSGSTSTSTRRPRRPGAPRDRVVRALDYLRRAGAPGGQSRRPAAPLPPAAPTRRPGRAGRVAAPRTLERETREIARLNQVLDLAGHDGCQASRLGAHFGEPLARPCGHCSWCENGRPAREAPPTTPVHLDEVSLRPRHSAAPGDPGACPTREPLPAS